VARAVPRISLESFREKIFGAIEIAQLHERVAVADLIRSVFGASRDGALEMRQRFFELVRPEKVISRLRGLAGLFRANGLLFPENLPPFDDSGDVVRIRDEPGIPGGAEHVLAVGQREASEALALSFGGLGKLAEKRAAGHAQLPVVRIGHDGGVVAVENRLRFAAKTFFRLGSRRRSFCGLRSIRRTGNEQKSGD
jgi:hypothetical protein